MGVNPDTTDLILDTFEGVIFKWDRIHLNLQNSYSSATGNALFVEYGPLQLHVSPVMTKALGKADSGLLVSQRAQVNDFQRPQVTRQHF